MTDRQEPTLEEALSRLEQITRSLEAGEIELDESLSLYEEGVRLIRMAEEAIRSAELRIERLNADGSLTKMRRPAPEGS
jgi:exodeoxyribonuclease VII small subunit